MDSDTPLDYALFQLSPRRTRCELFVSGDGRSEKLASGSLKPFAAHLRAADEQATSAASDSIKLEVDKWGHDAAWFNKGTLERFVRFVSTPEVLELVNTFDAEMSQLEGARKIYSQGAGERQPGASLGENESASVAVADATKKELLRAIDVRLVAVKQDLTLACARASAAGFTLENVSELLSFADCFGAQRLHEACTKFISLCQWRPDLISHQQSPSSLPPTQWKVFDDVHVRASSGSDMSIDEPEMVLGVLEKKRTNSTSGSHPVLKSSNSQPSQNAAGEPSATTQQPKPVTQRLTEMDVDKGTELPSPSETSVGPAQQVGGGGSRRLSVQDRINLFENKQKEQTTSTAITSSSTGSGTNKLAGKPEHRRLPSEVSVEKLVLRRWSGASDMSIDLNTTSSSSFNDRKESSSPVGISSSSINSHAQSDSRTEDEVGRLKDTATSWSLSESKDNCTLSSSSSSFPEAKVVTFSKNKDQPEVFIPKASIAAPKMDQGPTMEKELRPGQSQLGMPLGKVQKGGLDNQGATETSSKGFIDSREAKVQSTYRIQPKKVLEENVGVKDQMTPHIPSRAVSTALEQVEVEQKNQISMQPQLRDEIRADIVEPKGQPNPLTKSRAVASNNVDVGVKEKGFPDSQVKFRASPGTSKSDSLVPQSKWRSFPGKEEGGRTETAASNMPIEALPLKAEEDDSGPQGVKLLRRTTFDHTRKLQGRAPHQGNAAPAILGNKATEGTVVFSAPASSMEHIQVVRPSKGNQELNDELQLKANELEKLFAAHKLRVREDQGALRRSKSVDVDEDPPKSVQSRPAEVIHHQFPEEKTLRQSSRHELEFDSDLLLKMGDTKNYNNNMMQELDNFRPSGKVRGMFYEKYMQKRDAKLREESAPKRAQKEAKMKAMHDSLVNSEAELKSKFVQSANQQDRTRARRNTMKMRSFNARSFVKDKGQIEESLQGEEEDLQELSEHVRYAQDNSYNDTLFGGYHSININPKKLISSKVLSSTPRTPVAPVPRSSAKGTNSGSMKRRTQPENPLAQSVPNFSDFRKENTKPSVGLSKVTPRIQSKNFARSKSTNEDTSLGKEEKPRRSQSMRKSPATTGELKDLSALNSDGTSLTPLRFSKEQSELNTHRSSESRSFLRKGNGIGPGAGAGIAKLKASMATEILKNEEDSEGLEDHQDSVPDIVKDGDEESETLTPQENFGIIDFSAETDNEKPRLSQESGDSGDPGSEAGDALRSISQADDDLAAVSSKFDTSVGNMQESPVESPGSWNSHLHHSFSFALETSDIEASADSPTGSPASWNTHSLNQMMEADAARLRKKWGSAQIPVLVANAPHQSRKDATKVFKRLLKFGRKIKGSEYLINDWVSASTASEGDDDTEDGRDPASRSTDDLRKSRMGYPAAYEGFHESEIFPDQVQSLRSSIPNLPGNFKLRDDHLSGSSLKAPRPFFSLSSFRSKGSESKFR